MKKKYIQPTVSVSFVVVESLLTGTSGNNNNGIGPIPGDFGYGGAKKHDFTDDSFDNTAWPKDKSPWD